MSPILSQKIINNEYWIHQIKWDGIRGLTYIENNSFKLFNKHGRDRTIFYPELKESVKLLEGNQAILDGEIVIFDTQGRPSFNTLLMREKVRIKSNIDYYLKKYPVKYIIFDILYYNGEDLRAKPLLERMEILKNHYAKSSISTITDDFSNGKKLFQLMNEKNYEGIVSKKVNSSYISGKKHKVWYKIKTSKKILAIICGIKTKNNYPNSLILGVFKEGDIHYIGSVSAGLKQSDFILLKENINILRQQKSPLSNIKSRRDVIWIKPMITCWVSFLEWTDRGSLRHPKLIGFSSQSIEEANGRDYIDNGDN